MLPNEPLAALMFLCVIAAVITATINVMCWLFRMDKLADRINSLEVGLHNLERAVADLEEDDDLPEPEDYEEIDICPRCNDRLIDDIWFTGGEKVHWACMTQEEQDEPPF